METAKEMIAPCGLNCAVCYAHLRKENTCGGCLSPGGNKNKLSYRCGIKYCKEHNKASFTHCFECAKFPCGRLDRLYKRYQERYCLNVMANQLAICENGLDRFIEKEKEKWICTQCGATLSVHKSNCLACGKAYR